MTGKQSAVLWLGLALIITRLFTTNQWSELWSAFGVKAPSAFSSSPAQAKEGSGGAGGEGSSGSGQEGGGQAL
jgi:hypothetical protein